MRLLSSSLLLVLVVTVMVMVMVKVMVMVMLMVMLSWSLLLATFKGNRAGLNKSGSKLSFLENVDNIAVE